MFVVTSVTTRYSTPVSCRRTLLTLPERPVARGCWLSTVKRLSKIGERARRAVGCGLGTRAPSYDYFVYYKVTRRKCTNTVGKDELYISKVYDVALQEGDVTLYHIRTYKLSRIASFSFLIAVDVADVQEN